MRVLGIESSCDECSAAVVEDGRQVLSNLVLSQVDLHKPYYGVVPEIASRQHVEWIQGVVADALDGSAPQPRLHPPDRAKEIHEVVEVINANL